MKAKQAINKAEDIFDVVATLDVLVENGEVELDYDWSDEKTHYRFDDGSQVIIKNNEIESVS